MTKIKIRKGSLIENLYLSRRGEWVSYANAAVFSTQELADKFAAKYNITNYGLFH